MKIVNRTGVSRGIGIEVPGFAKATMKYVTMEGDLKDQNTTEDKFAIKPNDPVIVNDVLGGDVEVINVAGYSVTTVVFTISAN